MTQAAIIVNDKEAREVLGRAGQAKIHRGFTAGMRRALVAIERHHKRNETVRQAGEGMRLTSGATYTGIIQPAVPDKVTSRTGTWSKSYTRRIVEQEMFGGYGSDLKLAEWLELGTRPHEIAPVKAKALRFAYGRTLKRGRTGSGGMADFKRAFVFAKVVNHPGTAPRKTVERTIAATQDTVAAIFGNSIDVSLAGGRE